MTKTCTKCRLELPLSSFSRHKLGRDNLQSWCKACFCAAAKLWRKSNKDRHAASQRAWRENNPDKARSIDRKRGFKKYGLSAEEGEAILSNSCSICKSTNDLCIDHCHATGNVREALCRRCNSGIGLLRDDPTLVRAALEYLERHAQHNQELNQHG